MDLKKETEVDISQEFRHGEGMNEFEVFDIGEQNNDEDKIKGSVLKESMREKDSKQDNKKKSKENKQDKKSIVEDVSYEQFYQWKIEVK